MGLMETPLSNYLKKVSIPRNKKYAYILKIIRMYIIYICCIIRSVYGLKVLELLLNLTLATF